MDTNERYQVRNSLLDKGFTRRSATSDLNGNGDYAETWSHPDGTLMTVDWAAKTNTPTNPASPANTTDSTTQTGVDVAALRNEIATRLLPYVYEEGLESTDMSQKAWKQTFLNLLDDIRSTLNLADEPAGPLDEPMDSDDENLAEHTQTIRDRGITSAPGMYDEPDNGLGFTLPRSSEEDTIR